MGSQGRKLSRAARGTAKVATMWPTGEPGPSHGRAGGRHIGAPLADRLLVPLARTRIAAVRSIREQIQNDPLAFRAPRTIVHRKRVAPSNRPYLRGTRYMEDDDDDDTRAAGNAALNSLNQTSQTDISQDLADTLHAPLHVQVVVLRRAVDTMSGAIYTLMRQREEDRVLMLESEAERTRVEQEHQDEIADLKRLLEEGQREAASARSQDLDLLKESIERMSHHVASECSSIRRGYLSSSGGGRSVEAPDSTKGSREAGEARIDGLQTEFREFKDETVGILREQQRQNDIITRAIRAVVRRTVPPATSASPAPPPPTPANHRDRNEGDAGGYSARPPQGDEAPGTVTPKAVRWEREGQGAGPKAMAM